MMLRLSGWHVLLLLLVSTMSAAAQLRQVGLDGERIVCIAAEQGDPGEQWFPVTSSVLFAATRTGMVWQGRTWDDGKQWLPIGPFSDPPVDIVTLGLQHWGAGPMDGLHLLLSVRETTPSAQRPILLRRSVQYVGPFDSVWVRADSGIIHNDTASVVHAIAAYYYTGHTPPQPVLAWSGSGPLRGWPAGQYWEPASAEVSATVVSMDVTPKWWGTDAWAAGWTTEGPGDAVVFRSRDAGRTWTMFPFPRALPTKAMAVAVEPGHPDTAYAGMDGSLRRTMDGGATWEPVFGAPEGSIIALACDPRQSGRVFAASNAADFMLHRSDDFGATWRRILPAPDQFPASITGMTIAMADSMPAEPPYHRALFLGTNGTGVWRYDIDGDPTPVRPLAAPASPHLELFPSPATAAVTAQLRLPVPIDVTVSIHDLLGRTLLLQPYGLRGPGSHAFTLDISRFSPGVYIMRAAGAQALLRVIH